MRLPLLSGLILVTAVQLQGQSIEVGGRIGVTSSGVTLNSVACPAGGSDPCRPTEYQRTSLMAGAFARIRLFGNLSLQPELAYVPRGTGGPGGVHLAYLEAPVLLRYDLRELPIGTFFVQAGPVFATQLSCRVHPSVGGPVDCEDDAGLGYRPPTRDLGVAWGVGATAGAGVGRMDIEFRGLEGFTDLDPSYVSAKSSSLTLSIGYSVAPQLLGR